MVILNLLPENLHHPIPSYIDRGITYAQKSFLGYFGQNWAKIKKNFFGNSLHIAVYNIAIKPQKYCLKNLFSKKFFFDWAPYDIYRIGTSGQKKIILTDLESGHLN